MKNLFKRNPLPWHIGFSGTILDANSKIVISFLKEDLANTIVEAVNAHFNEEPLEAENLHSVATVYVVQDVNGVYLRNSKNDDWTDTPKLARKFNRRSDATQCINANGYDAEVVALEVY